MGKKGNWFSAIKRVFTHNSKEKLDHGSEKKKEKKKWGLGKLKHGESNSFVPLHRKPSSIEKILGDAEREQQKILPSLYAEREQQKTLPVSHAERERQRVLPILHAEREQQRVLPILHAEREQQRVLPILHTEREQQRVLPMSLEQRRTPSPSIPSRVVVNHHKEVNYIPTATPRNLNISAIKIQAAYRGYMARRSFRALKGLVRLQGVVRGQSVKRQTTNAMKSMQLLVRVQSQIQSRRIQMFENKALQHQKLHKSDNDIEGSLNKWSLTHPNETGYQEEWDDSLLTKEEIDARLQRKMEAVIKRERAFAYAYSNQLWKATPKSAQAALMEIRSGGFPLWWNWLEQFPSESKVMHVKKNDATPPTPPIPTPETRPQSSNFRHPRLGLDNLDSLTPNSSKSPIPMKTKHTPTFPNRATQTNSSTPVKRANSRITGAAFSLDVSIRDDESLTSCPPFSVPNYMVPTVSAKAKVRAHSNPRERSIPTTPSNDQKRRLSFPLSWNKGSLFSSKDSTSHRISGKHKSMQSISNLSVDSTVSLPVGIGMKSFK